MLPLLAGRRFQVLFHSPHRGAFHLSLTVLVHYRSPGSIQPWKMVLPNSRRIPRAPRYLGSRSGRRIPFHLQASHLLRSTFPDASATDPLCNSPEDPEIFPTGPATPDIQRLRALTYIRFGLFPFRSPLLRKSLLFSFPGATKMFQFAPFASAPYVFRRGCPGIPRNRFPHSEISGSVLVWQLPEAYRSLPRLSSPPGTQASAVCPMLADFFANP